MTEWIRRALAELKARLSVPVVQPHPKTRLMEFLERSVWPKVVPGGLGRPITKQEEDEILGYGRAVSDAYSPKRQRGDGFSQKLS